MNTDSILQNVRRLTLPHGTPPSPPPELSEDETTEGGMFTCCVHLRDFDAEDHIPTVLFPCGHTVCDETCRRETRCPICRQPFRHHAVNRNVLDLIRVMREASTTAGEITHEKNAFLMALRKHQRVIDRMTVESREWTVEQWGVFRELVDAMKLHAPLITRTWIDASGCHEYVAVELRKMLTKIKRVAYNRQKLGWDKIGDLPMCV